MTALVVRSDAPAPYYADEHATLYHGDCRDILPELGVTADCVIADPPYGETSLPWDRWPDGWVDVTAGVTSSMWCFGSLRMFMERQADFKGWRLSQDVIWEKQQGSGWDTDRFMRVHENITHWYQGSWADQHRTVPRTPHYGPDKTWQAINRDAGGRAEHKGSIGPRDGYNDDGSRLMRSVMRVDKIRPAHHPTQKPTALVDPLIRYSCPEGGLVVDPFTGSGTTLAAAKMLGRHAIGVEVEERYCEIAARRLSQGVLDFSEVTG